MKNLLKPDYERLEGVRPINLYVMKFYFLLMFLFVAYESWSVLLTHEGDWDPTRVVVWCMWATYSTLSIFGVFHTLKMLPVMLFMILYKTLWLVVVALPLWLSDSLIGSSAEGMALIFIWVFIPMIFLPWGYVFKTFILGKKEGLNLRNTPKVIS